VDRQGRTPCRSTHVPPATRRGAAALRKPAAGEPGRDIVTTENRGSGRLASLAPRTALQAFYALRPA